VDAGRRLLTFAPDGAVTFFRPKITRRPTRRALRRRRTRWKKLVKLSQRWVGDWVRLGPGEALRKASKDLTSGPHMRIAFLEEVKKTALHVHQRKRNNSSQRFLHSPSTIKLPLARV